MSRYWTDILANVCFKRNSVKFYCFKEIIQFAFSISNQQWWLENVKKIYHRWNQKSKHLQNSLVQAASQVIWNIFGIKPSIFQYYSPFVSGPWVTDPLQDSVLSKFLTNSGFEQFYSKI